MGEFKVKHHSFAHTQENECKSKHSNFSSEKDHKFH